MPGIHGVEIVGGAVRGGRVLADWPGLAPNALYEARDLAPTRDLDALIASATAECFGLDTGEVMHRLFPDRKPDPKLAGLVSA